MYRFGALKWDGYLIDIQNAVYANTDYQIETANRNNARLASRIDELREGLESRSDELLTRVSDGFADVCESIEDLGYRMEEGLALIADVLTDQLEVLTEISEKLSAINETLQNAIVTQAREFVRLGFKCLKHGL